MDASASGDADFDADFRDAVDFTLQERSSLPDVGVEDPPAVGAQLPKVINTFGKRPDVDLLDFQRRCLTESTSESVCQHGDLRLVDVVRTIHNVQSRLEDQLAKNHGELLREIREAIHMPPDESQFGNHQGFKVMGFRQPGADCVDEARLPDGPPPVLSGEFGQGLTNSSTGLDSQPKLRRQSTNELTNAALKRANLKNSVCSQFDVKKMMIMPKSAEDVKKRLQRSAAASLLRWNGFDKAMGFIIVLNAICIGQEINMSTQNEVSEEVASVLANLEVVFLVIYTWELGLRFYVDGFKAIHNRWVAFDCALVSSGICATVFRSLVEFATDTGLQEAMKQVMLLRIVRLLRLVRALRLVRQFKTLWRLTNGLMTSIDTVLSALSLVALVLYVASCIGVELITGNQALRAIPEIAELIEAEYNSVPATMMSLMQFVTLDDLSNLYKPIIREQPVLSLYFVTILMIVSITLMNLITAVIVEGALEKARKDHEMEAIQLKRQVKSYLPVARELFRKMDTDGNGVLTLDEIMEKIDEDPDRELQNKLQEIVPFESIVELFESLDVDGDGEIPEQEFIDGVLKAALAGNDNIQIAQILRLLRIQGRKMEKLEAHVGVPKTMGSATCALGSFG